ncbi:MAG: molybdopterin molybdotransferase MoeA, partial [Defluviitaleaceae bacterium]|nr:molybdopterin molybdotransferase MoeA [Defluviitaleaceae bacterium]
DIGTLAVAGVGEVAVFARPSICFISTGDELLSPHTSPLENGKIRETNSLSLSALARKLGFNVEKTMTLPDDENTIKQAIIQSMEKYDIVAITGGSSQGKKDMTAEILDAVSGGGVFTHGIAIKPGKPTILGVDKPSQTLLVGLPGHPVSSMTVFELIFGWLWRRLMGVPEGFPIVAKLTDNVPGSAGKLTFYACKLSLDADGYKACPIFSKSGLISSLSAADGYFLIAQDTEGLRKNDTVHVHLY